MLGIALINLQAQQAESDQANTQSQNTIPKLNHVCMVDNEYKDSLLIAVEIDGKTYYGCCQPCVEYLEADETIRYARDPVTNGLVNKADAFIAFEKDGTWKVLYFESEKNYKIYKGGL
jgi:YHS domain-containing protein